ncbi:MAG: TrkA family potassium uptake protein [Ruminococcaceae bacterium]|nr:TrkA family potassium uptake protein [Oscillospiraceae bacterium]
MKNMEKPSSFAVIGLGHFGLSIVQTLSNYDVEVLACDKEAEKLHLATDYATYVVQADVTDETTLEKMGIGNFETVILAMGEDFEATVIATLKAKELGAKYVVAKATGMRQKKILETVGADLVVLPENEMGAKIAQKLMRSNIFEVLLDSDKFLVVEMKPREDWIDKTVRETDMRRKDSINLIAIIRDDHTVLTVFPDTVIKEGDVLITICNPN